MTNSKLQTSEQQEHDQSSLNESEPNQSGPNQSGPNQSGPNHSGPNQSGPNHSGRDQQREPKLQAPGAGIPKLELLIAKHIIFPMRFKNTSVATAIAEFRDESDKILQLARELSIDQLSERRLIPRLQGLEDSSRFWSIAMTMEHLAIVGGGTRGVLLALSRNQTNLPRRGTADVKPSVDLDVQRMLTRFEEVVSDFIRTAEKIDYDKFPEARHPHPWFGPLTAKQWLMFAAPHQKIHRRQIEEIKARL
ncbi:MAG TPA: DinB family protein [Drouetiella sp.]|jgi:DinB superfamily